RGVPQPGRLRLRAGLGDISHHLRDHALGQPDELQGDGGAEGRGQDMRPGSRIHYLSILAVAAAVVLGIWWLIATAPEPVMRDRMLVIPGGWKRFLGIFTLACGGVAAIAYLYGLATRP